MRKVIFIFSAAIVFTGCASTSCKNVDVINNKIKNSTGVVREQLIEELKDAETKCQLELQKTGEYQKTQSLNNEQRAKELRK